MIPSLLRPHPRLAWRAGALALGLLASACAARAALYTALTDAIPYASWNAAAPQMDDLWTANTGNLPVADGGTFRLANGVVGRVLPHTLTNNFELTIDTLHGDYQRGIWVGIFNSAGTQGYGFLWDSSTSGSQGLVSIRRFTVAGPSSLVFNSYGTILGTSIASGRSPVTGSLAQIKLTWTQATGALNLYVDGVLKRTLTDTSYSLFSRVFVSGNGTGALPSRFDNVLVTANDSTSPNVSVTAPAEGATVSGNVSLTATATDNLAVAGVQFRLNNTTNIGAEDTVAPYTVNWNTVPLEKGYYQITALVRDVAGNTRISTPIGVIVNNPGSRGVTRTWTLYEAEDGTLANGAQIITGTQVGQSTHPQAFEARGKQAVLLGGAGQSVLVGDVVGAGHLIVRYSLPVNTTPPAGSIPTSATVGLYINGTLHSNLALNSSRMHEPKPTGEIPGGWVRFYDEIAIPVTVSNSGNVKLQFVSGSPVTIDFIELETVPSALTVPDASWVVVSGNTGGNIQTAINTANGGSKKVWIPAGTYTINSTVTVPGGIEIRGAGMWHTKLMKNFGGTGNHAIRINGPGVTVRDLQGVDTITQLSGNNSNGIFNADDSTDLTLRNIWTEYASLVIAYNSTRVTAIGCRVRNGYKDAIHIAGNASQGLIQNCSFRNVGDDSAAFVAYGSTTLNSCRVEYSTMECTYWGRPISFQGGDGHSAEYNVVIDSTLAGILVAIDGWGNNPKVYWPKNINFLVRYNTVIRCGSQVNAAYGSAVAIWGDSAGKPMSGVMSHNTILDSLFDGAKISGHVGDATHQVLFQNNSIEQPSTPGYDRKVISLQSGSEVDHEPNTDL